MYFNSRITRNLKIVWRLKVKTTSKPVESVDRARLFHEEVRHRDEKKFLYCEIFVQDVWANVWLLVYARTYEFY